MSYSRFVLCKYRWFDPRKVNHFFLKLGSVCVGKPLYICVRVYISEENGQSTTARNYAATKNRGKVSELQ